MEILPSCHVSFRSKLFGSGSVEVHDDYIKIKNHANEVKIIRKLEIIKLETESDLDKLNKDMKSILIGTFAFGLIGAAYVATKHRDEISKYIRVETNIRELEEIYITFLGETCDEYEILRSWIK